MLNREGAVFIKSIKRESSTLSSNNTSITVFILLIALEPRNSSIHLSKFRQPLARSTKLALIGRDIVFALAKHCVPWQRKLSGVTACSVSLGANGVPVCYTTEISMCLPTVAGSAECGGSS